MEKSIVKDRGGYAGVGVMSGSSLDGLDLVYASFECLGAESWEFEILQTETIPFDESTRQGLRNLGAASALDLVLADVEFGHLIGRTVSQFTAHLPSSPQWVGCHGHTVFHQPEKGLTAQLGRGQVIVRHLPFPVVTDFRVQDVARGGQGAPLVPFGEKALFGEETAFLNLGGIANLTTPLVAYDICPCNQVLNTLVGEVDATLDYDPEGKVAASGVVEPALLEAWGQLPWYRQSPPRSLGREWIEDVFMPVYRASSVSPVNALRTAVEHIAKAIQLATRERRATLDRVVVTGGGAFNTYLIERLRALAPETTWVIPDQGLVAYKEALIFAFLGLMALIGQPNILARQTGAREPSIAGAIHLPSTFRGFPRIPGEDLRPCS